VTPCGLVNITGTSYLCHRLS